MTYKVIVTRDAEEDLDNFIKYLITEKKAVAMEIKYDRTTLENLTEWDTEI